MPWAWPFTAETEPYWAGLTASLWAPDLGASLVRSVYETRLGRDAEDAGLEHWISLLAGGRTAQDFARDVAGAPEFQALHGGQTDQQFVTALYQSGLGRIPQQRRVRGDVDRQPRHVAGPGG